MACGLRTKGLRAMRVRMGRDSLMVDPTGGGGVLTDGICSGADGARLQVKTRPPWCSPYSAGSHTRWAPSPLRRRNLRDHTGG